MKAIEIIEKDVVSKEVPEFNVGDMDGTAQMPRRVCCA